MLGLGEGMLMENGAPEGFSIPSLSVGKDSRAELLPDSCMLINDLESIPGSPVPLSSFFLAWLSKLSRFGVRDCERALELEEKGLPLYRVGVDGDGDGYILVLLPGVGVIGVIICSEKDVLGFMILLTDICKDRCSKGVANVSNGRLCNHDNKLRSASSVGVPVIMLRRTI